MIWFVFETLLDLDGGIDSMVTPSAESDRIEISLEGVGKL